MIGYARAYQARHELDMRQAAMLKQALPAPYLPTANPYVVALAVDEQLFGHNDGLSQTLVGFLQTSWSARDVLQTMYRRTDVRSVAGPGWAVRPVTYTPAGATAAAELRVLGAAVPIETTILFVYEGGKTSVIESLVFQSSDGAKQTVRFPAADTLSGAGLPTLTNYPAPRTGKTVTGDLRYGRADAGLCTHPDN